MAEAKRPHARGMFGTTNDVPTPSGALTSHPASADRAETSGRTAMTSNVRAITVKTAFVYRSITIGLLERVMAWNPSTPMGVVG